jgi:hypothetical protein
MCSPRDNTSPALVPVGKKSGLGLLVKNLPARTLPVNQRLILALAYCLAG